VFLTQRDDQCPRASQQKNRRSRPEYHDLRDAQPHRPAFDDVRDHYFHEAAIAKFGNDPHEPIHYPTFLTEKLVAVISEAHSKLHAGSP